MGELIKSLTFVASQSLRNLHLAQLKIHSNANAEALGKLICRKAVLLERISLEQMFGKRKLFDLCFQSNMNRIACQETIREFSIR